MSYYSLCSGQRQWQERIRELWFLNYLSGVTNVTGLFSEVFGHYLTGVFKMHSLKTRLIKFKSLTSLLRMENKEIAAENAAWLGKYSQVKNTQKKRARHFHRSGGSVPYGLAWCRADGLIKSSCVIFAVTLQNNGGNNRQNYFLMYTNMPDYKRT